MNLYTTPTMHVFIDESGTVMSGARESNLYICTAVIVSENNKQAVIDGLFGLIKKHKLGTILKSSSIGSNNQRRIAILRDLMSLDFSYLFLLTDKSKFLPDSPLEKYKKIRYKFLHKKLNWILEEKNYNLKVIIDKHGSDEFQKECLKYYQKNTQTLFSGTLDIDYADDKDEVILQIADFIGGSLMYCFDKDRKGEHSEQIRQILQRKEVGCEFFPRGTFSTIDTRPIPAADLEEQLYRQLYNNATLFLDKTEESSDELEQMQYQTLNRLFIARCYEEPSHQWIYSEDLYEDLKEQSFDISKRAFTVKVIGGLRYKGIIIAGSPNGYKLALNLEDINNYLAHDNNIVFPMLDKLKLARDQVNALIGHNILGGEYESFDLLINALTTDQIRKYTDEPDVEKIQMIEDIND